MSSTTATAIKALLEGEGLGVSVHRDQAPPDVAYPYITISEAVSVADETAFNPRTDPLGHVREEIDVDLWQQWRAPTGTRAVTEEPGLADAVYAALRAAGLPTAPNHVSGMTVTGMRRLFERENNVIHHVITCEVRRVLTRDEAS